MVLPRDALKPARGTWRLQPLRTSVGSGGATPPRERPVSPSPDQFRRDVRARSRPRTGAPSGDPAPRTRPPQHAPAGPAYCASRGKERRTTLRARFGARAGTQFGCGKTGFAQEVPEDPPIVEAPVLRLAGGASEPALWPPRASLSPPNTMASACMPPPANDRAALERFIRYCLRPISLGRLSLLPNGSASDRLRKPRADATTHRVFTPHAFLTRLSWLIAQPHIHLIRYHGIFAPHRAWRGEIVLCRPAPEEESSVGQAQRASERPLVGIHTGSSRRVAVDGPTKAQQSIITACRRRHMHSIDGNCCALLCEAPRRHY